MLYPILFCCLFLNIKQLSWEAILILLIVFFLPFLGSNVLESLTFWKSRWIYFIYLCFSLIITIISTEVKYSKLFSLKWNSFINCEKYFLKLKIKLLFLFINVIYFENHLIIILCHYFFAFIIIWGHFGKYIYIMNLFQLLILLF